MKFTVSRKNWLRNIYSDDSRLLREDGKRCCLGFVAQQCGFSDDEILNKAAPCDADKEKRSQFPAWFFNAKGQTVAILDAMRINDDRQLTDEEREPKIAAIFANHSDEIEFVP